MNEIQINFNGEFIRNDFVDKTAAAYKKAFEKIKSKENDKMNNNDTNKRIDKISYYLGVRLLLKMIASYQLDMLELHVVERIAVTSVNVSARRITSHPVKDMNFVDRFTLK